MSLLTGCGGGSSDEPVSERPLNSVLLTSWDEGDVGLLTPLGKHDRWTYVERRKLEQSEPTMLFQKVLGVSIDDAGTVSKIHYNFEGESSSLEYRRKTSTGLSVVGQEFDQSAFGDPGTIGLLRLPITVGDAYVAADTRRYPNSYVLGEASPHLELRVQVLRQESVETPAGIFNDAVLIRSTLNAYLVSEPTTLVGSTVIDEWHVPGVGVVRSAEFDAIGKDYASDYLVTSYWVRGKRNEFIAPVVTLNETGEDKGLPGPNDDRLFFTFSEVMDEWTITKDSVYLEDETGRRVSSGVSLDGREAHIRINHSEHGRFTAVITTDVQDRAGNPIAQEIRWPVVMDRSDLNIIEALPLPGSSDVSLQADIVLTFNKPLLQPLPSQAVRVYRGDDEDDPTLSVGVRSVAQGNVIRVTNPSAWQPATRYRVVVSDQLRDGALNTPEQEFVFHFTTTQAQFSTGETIERVPGSRSIAVGDFNNDGRDDLAEVALASESGVSVTRLFVRLQNSSGQFTEGPIDVPTSPSAECWPERVHAADFNGDSRDDVLIDCISGYFVLHVQSSNGTLASPQLFPETYGPVQLNNIRVADINGDGRADLIDQGFNGAMRMRLQSASGILAPATLINIGAEQGGDFVVSDFNADGLPDIAVFIHNIQYINGGPDWVDKRIVVMRQNAGGGFQKVQTIELPEGAGYISLASGDINKDGHEDLFLSAYRSSVREQQAWSINYLGQADGLLAPGVDSGGYSAQNLSMIDMNGDGLLDQVFTQPFFYAAQRVSGGYDKAISFGVSSDERFLDTGDLNSDGLADVIMGNRQNQWVIFEGTAGSGLTRVQALRSAVVTPR